MNTNRMLLRLYAYPILLLIISLVAMFILGSMIPNNFSESNILSGIGSQIKALASIVSLFFFCAFLWGMLFNSFELWRWFNGKSVVICDNCGGMTKYHSNGRYGPYHKCIACGNNRADR